MMDRSESRGCDRCRQKIINDGFDPKEERLRWNKPVTMFNYHPYWCDPCVIRFAEEWGLHPTFVRNINSYYGFYRTFMQKINRDILEMGNEEREGAVQRLKKWKTAARLNFVATMRNMDNYRLSHWKIWNEFESSVRHYILGTPQETFEDINITRDNLQEFLNKLDKNRTRFPNRRKE